MIESKEPFSLTDCCTGLRFFLPTLLHMQGLHPRYPGELLFYPTRESVGAEETLKSRLKGPTGS